MEWLSAERTGVDVAAGCLYLEKSWHGHTPSFESIREISRNRLPAFWWFAAKKGDYGWAVRIPLWFPLTLSLIATAAAWRLDALARARAVVGLCPKCHYELRGLAPGAKCPECGV